MDGLHLALHPLFMGRCSIVFGNQTFASFSGLKYIAKILRTGSLEGENSIATSFL